MYSSGMRTVRLLTVSQHALDMGCVSQYVQGRVYVYPIMHWAGDVCPMGMFAQGVSANGGACQWGVADPLCGQNDIHV